MRLDTGKYLIFDGSLRVTYGDYFTPSLLNQSSNVYKDKAQRYKTMVENLYNKSDLGAALRHCSVTGFSNGSLVVFFRLILDRRKIPKKTTNIEDAARLVIQAEAMSLKPVALKNIRVDPKQIYIRRNMDQTYGHMIGETDAIKRNINNNITTEVRNGVIRKAPAHSTAVNNTAKENNEKKSQKDGVVKGSFKITSSEKDEANVKEKTDQSSVSLVSESASVPATERTLSKGTKNHRYYSTRHPTSTTRERLQLSSSSTTPEPARPYSIQHSPGLTAIIKKEQMKVTSLPATPADKKRKPEVTEQQDLMTLLPYLLPNTEAPWRPILPENFTRHPQRRPATEDYNSAPGVGVAEVILDSSEENERVSPHILDYSHSSRKTVDGSLMLGESMPERAQLHEGPRSSDKVSTFQLFIRQEDDSGGDILHTASGDIIRRPDHHESSSERGVSSAYELPDFAQIKQFHVLDTLLKSYDDAVSKHMNSESILNTGRSSSAKFNLGHLNLSTSDNHKEHDVLSTDTGLSTASLSEYKSSELPIVTLIPVRSNLGIGRPLRPRPKPTTSSGVSESADTNQSSSARTMLSTLTTPYTTSPRSTSINRLRSPLSELLASSAFSSNPLFGQSSLSPTTQRLVFHNATTTESDETTSDEFITEFPSSELLTETDPIPTTITPTQFDESNYKTDELETPTRETDIVTESAPPLEDATITTLLFTTDINQSEEYLSPVHENSSTAQKHLHNRQAKMRTDAQNKSIRMYVSNDSSDLYGRNTTEDGLLQSDARNGSHHLNRTLLKNSYDIQILLDEIFDNNTLPLNILLTALTLNTINKTNRDDNPSPIYYNPSAEYNNLSPVYHHNATTTQRNVKDINLISNMRPIDVDSYDILLGNHTIVFPPSVSNERNKSNSILNNETFKFLTSSQYFTKDKKLLVSPAEEETPKSVSLSYTVNNAGLGLLTKVYNKVPVTKESDKDREKMAHLPNLLVSNTTTDCTTNNSVRCGSGECVPVLSRCNQLVDCADGSDEKNCTCIEFLQAQFLTRKICDGVIDCWDFTDENKCEWCTPGQYVCTDSRVCVDRSRLCDGAKDCPLGDDERHCVTISPSLERANDMAYYPQGYLMVRKGGEWGKLCLQNFKDLLSPSKSNWSVPDIGRAICKAMTYSDFEQISRKQDVITARSDRAVYFELSNISNDTEDTTFRPNLSFRKTDCSQKEVVQVACKELECGMRPQAITRIQRGGARRGLRHSRIVGGGNAGPGSWPWQAALYKEGEFQCGATLISDRWLLSAGHCFYHALEEYWVARLGALRRGTSLPSPYEQLRPVARILLHPGYVDTGFVNDISLLRLETAVTFTNYVRPICLPRPNAPVEDGAMCTVVGWGQLFEVGRIFPDTLQEVQLPVISTAECRKRTLFLPLYRVTENMFCAGYDRGGRDACLGDSGGPLMCQESDGRWSLVGVTSNGCGCARANRPGVYTKVANYLGWVQSSIGSGEAAANRSLVKAACHGHRCPLGECLPPARVCNGFMECSDGSDEKECW